MYVESIRRGRAEMSQLLHRSFTIGLYDQQVVRFPAKSVAYQDTLNNCHLFYLHPSVSLFVCGPVIRGRPVTV